LLRRGEETRPEGDRERAVNFKKKQVYTKFCGGNTPIWACASRALAVASLLLASVPALARQAPEATESNSRQQSATPGATAAGAPPTNQQVPAEQQSAVRISGRIVDQTGVAVVGARITLTGQNSWQSQETLTGDDGLFTFTNAAPGSFHLTMAAAGFATQEFSGILSSTENFTVPQIVLTVASVNTEVRVVPPSQVEIAREQIREEEKQRALGIIPNFYVTYIPDAAPLTPGQKFGLAWKSMVDPVTFGLTGAIAGLQQAQNDFSGYGQGAEGYGRRYGAAYGDMVTSTLIGSAILPSLLKQDPRYFYKGTGSKRSRLLYAIANSVICKGDNGRWQANYSAIIGGLAAGGISNLYYPAKDREGAELTFENALIGIGATAAANVLQEFVIKKFTSNTPRSDPGGSNAKPSGPIAKMFNSFVHEGY
jgi:Carboxypeptidase regulatory-like domain